MSSEVALLARAVALLGGRGRRLARERSMLVEDARFLERALIPEVPERVGPLSASVAYRPADGPGAGGDFYDVFPLDSGRVAAIVGDVSGHGRAALERATLMHYTLRAYLETGLPPRSVIELADKVRAGGSEGLFATAVIAIYDAGQATLTYACAGHPPPIVLGTVAHEPVTVCASPPIGLGMPTALRQSTIALPAGSTACLYTDGVVEARSGDSLLGRERLAELVEEFGSRATAAELLDRVAIEAGGTPDDMAACFIRPLKGTSAGNAPNGGAGAEGSGGRSGRALPAGVWGWWIGGPGCRQVGAGGRARSRHGRAASLMDSLRRQHRGPAGGCGGTALPQFGAGSGDPRSLRPGMAQSAALKEVVEAAAPPRGVEQGRSHRLPAAFEQLESFPALTESRNRLLLALVAEHPSHGELIAAIEADIALVVAILRLANRVESSQRGRVFTIPQAVEVLTPDGVEMVARRIAVVEFFEHVPGWEVTPDEVRRHSVITQRVTDQLAIEAESDTRDELAVAALLHDVGKLVMGVAYADYPESIGDGTPGGAAARRARGVRHRPRHGRRRAHPSLGPPGPAWRHRGSPPRSPCDRRPCGPSSRRPARALRTRTERRSGRDGPSRGTGGCRTRAPTHADA